LISQIVTSNRGGRRKKPFAFTEHGTVMLASVLRSKWAAQMNIAVVRAFVKLRETLHLHANMSRELGEIRSFMLKQSNRNDQEFRKVWRAIEALESASKEDEAEGRPSIGFKIDSA